MTDSSGDLARPSRRQRRLINFLAPQLQANEQIVNIVTVAHEQVNPAWTSGPTVALVFTTQRIFELRLTFLTPDQRQHSLNTPVRA